MTMELISEILAHAADLTKIRRDIHAHPEIGFHEHRTAAIVAARLAEWGVEVHRGLGGTGVVGVIRGNRPGRRIGLRADMDALPMTEATGAIHASVNPGAFHGCGHDGHTTMLLGAARYLASTRRFAGDVVLIFQPAEEGVGGARAMIADGLFSRFPCDEIYGLHNWPGAPLGEITVKPGVALAASDQFDIRIQGRGAHGAMPHQAADPIMAATAIAQALQTIVSRNVEPMRTAVVSVTMLHAGSAYNVIPDVATLGGTIRTFDTVTRALVAERLATIAQAVGAGFGVEAEAIITPRFPAVVNGQGESRAAIAIARDLVGPDLARVVDQPVSGSEDFAEMLAVVPGAFLFLGQGEGPALHNPRYDFNDAVTPIGASLLARIAEARTGAELLP